MSVRRTSSLSTSRFAKSESTLNRKLGAEHALSQAVRWVPSDGGWLSRTKKQYIWRFQIMGKDMTVELFNSTLSSKKKIMVNNQLKAEMKQ